MVRSVARCGAVWCHGVVRCGVCGVCGCVWAGVRFAACCVWGVRCATRGVACDMRCVACGVQHVVWGAWCAKCGTVGCWSWGWMMGGVWRAALSMVCAMVPLRDDTAAGPPPTVHKLNVMPRLDSMALFAQALDGGPSVAQHRGPRQLGAVPARYQLHHTFPFPFDNASASTRALPCVGHGFRSRLLDHHARLVARVHAVVQLLKDAQRNIFSVWQTQAPQKYPPTQWRRAMTQICPMPRIRRCYYSTHSGPELAEIGNIGGTRSQKCAAACQVPSGLFGAIPTFCPTWTASARS